MALTNKYSLNGDSVDLVAGNNGTDSNISYVPGSLNRCASFNGTSSRIALPNSTIPNTVPFSISVIASCNVTGGAGSLGIINLGALSTDNSCGLSFGQAPEGNKIFFFVYGRANTIANSAFSTSKKYHIVATLDSSKVCKLYIDSVLQTSSQTYSTINITNSNHNIGNFGGGAWLNGTEDEISIFNTDMPNSKIKNEYAFYKGFF